MTTSTERELPSELQAALRDLRRIREVVDAADTNHPLRLIGRPVMAFLVVYGLAMMGFGIAAQLLLERGTPVLGLSPELVVWILGGLGLVITGVVKSVVFAVYARRAGFDINLLFRRLFTPGYLRVLWAVSAITTVSCVGLALNGAAPMLLGVITVGIGAIWVIASSVLPLRELLWFGLLYIVLGTLATFLFPEWTFYKLAAVWGGTPILVGAIVYRLAPPMPTLQRDREE